MSKHSSHLVSEIELNPSPSIMKDSDRGER